MKASVIKEQVDNEILLNIDKLFRKLMTDDTTTYLEDRKEHCQDVAEWLKEILPIYIDNSLQIAQGIKPFSFSCILEDQRHAKAVKEAEEERKRIRKILGRDNNESNS